MSSVNFLLRFSANKVPDRPLPPCAIDGEDATSIWPGAIRHLLGYIHLALEEKAFAELSVEDQLWLRTVVAKAINYVVSNFIFCWLRNQLNNRASKVSCHASQDEQGAPSRWIWIRENSP